ncbi:biotin--[acetyl-CoA-carboxylase] ligase [Deferribacteraceae bacterium V6Fe1]|nr:biotin--[acetyl-CoA-carboxylase] ligase [Deferribacteraceae bacterium V6Fe1]
MFDKKLYFKILNTKELGRNFLYFQSIDSTNTYAIENDLPYGSIIFADMQTKGKGRSNRKWSSSCDENLYFSCVLGNIKPENLLQLNIVIGYAVCDVIRKYADCYLKWPNDIMINNKKAGGILIETRFSGNRLAKVIFGIGINVNNTYIEETLKDIAISLKIVLGKDLSRETLLAELVNELEIKIEQLKNDFIDLKKLWPSYSCCFNREISVTVDNKKSIFFEKGINHYGGLIVSDKSGIERVLYSGDIGYDFCS